VGNPTKFYYKIASYWLFLLIHAWGSRRKHPHILSHNVRLMLEDTVTLRPFYPRQNRHRLFTGRLLWSRSWF